MTRTGHWRTAAIAIAAALTIAAAAPTAWAEDQAPGAPGTASEAAAGDAEGCPYAKDGAPCCTSCREKAAQAAAGEGKAAAESQEGGCPCQRRALLQQKAAEGASAP